MRCQERQRRSAVRHVPCASASYTEGSPTETVATPLHSRTSLPLTNVIGRPQSRSATLQDLTGLTTALHVVTSVVDSRACVRGPALCKTVRV